jgi:glycosyltransferase involved in cell wall biosynthesis
VVDTEIYRPARAETTGQVAVGWIGSPSTWAYVRPILPMLEAVAAECDLRISVVGAGPKAETGPLIQHHAWSEEEEIGMIQRMDIGIMPLPDEPYARGKCGYKLIQYMACGLPVIASPVGVNAEIVVHGVNGFLARSDAEWAEAIRRLAGDPGLRAAMGAKGRSRVERLYSLQVQGPRLARIFHDVIDKTHA